MTFTYSNTSITTPLAKVRLQIGDTDSTDPLFTDEEINVYLGNNGDAVVATAIDLFEVLIAKFSRQFDFETDQQKFARSQRVAHYQSLLDELRSSGSASGLTTVGQTKKDGYSQDISADEAVTNSRTGHASVGYYDPDRSW